MRDYAKLPFRKVIDAADLGDTAVFWFCFGIVVGVIIGELI